LQFRQTRLVSTTGTARPILQASQLIFQIGAAFAQADNLLFEKFLAFVSHMTRTKGFVSQ
jgi:hypothetical protein